MRSMQALKQELEGARSRQQQAEQELHAVQSKLRETAVGIQQRAQAAGSAVHRLSSDLDTAKHQRVCLEHSLHSEKQHRSALEAQLQAASKSLGEYQVCLFWALFECMTGSSTGRMASAVTEHRQACMHTT